MAPSVVHLPNGHNLTVTPVFGGLYFKSVDLHNAQSIFPPGWTIILHSQDDDVDYAPPSYAAGSDDSPPPRRHVIHTYRKPSLQNDHLFFSSISNPATNDSLPQRFPQSSPTRQIAMMLWATLWWYFHQPEPSPQLCNDKSANTADAGKPKGEWRLNINREGIFKGKQLMQKLERMGLIMTEDSNVGTDLDPNTPEGWSRMFVSRRHFWQLNPRVYLFTLSPQVNSAHPSGLNSPSGSRSGSPTFGLTGTRPDSMIEPSGASAHNGLWVPPGQFRSSSQLPTYYPPAPAQYVFTNNIRHPIRPKPPRQGETFYTRYIPSLGEYLSFRVASLADRAVQHLGPVANSSVPSGTSPLKTSTSVSDTAVPTLDSLNLNMSDSELLHKWMNDPRVAYSWGEDGPLSHQKEFLTGGLKNKHSFPVIGCFDGQPFGYFEMYWVKEDRLGTYLGGNVGDYDRGVHVLVGEQKFRGPHRIKVWLSALVHACFLADARTETVMLEPRVDNEKLKRYCEEVGFYKEREISFPHKQSNLMKIRRDAWDAPAI